MRFNSITGDWEILDKVYTSLEVVQQAIDTYNQDSGTVEIDL